MDKGHITGRRQNFNKKKIKIEGVAFISKNSLNHTSETPKSLFFSISYFQKCFYMQSLPTANFSLVWPNFRTPYCTILCNSLLHDICKSLFLLYYVPAMAFHDRFMGNNKNIYGIVLTAPGQQDYSERIFIRLRSMFLFLLDFPWLILYSTI